MASRRKAKKKKKKEKRRDNLRKLRKKVREAGVFEEGEVAFLPSVEEKMSEVVKSFIKPYFHLTHTHEQRESLISSAIIAWNAALLPKNEGKKMIDKVTNEMSLSGADAEDFKHIVADMMRRKIRHFSDNTRVIVDYQLSESREGIHLSVASTPPDDYEFRPDDEITDL